MTKAIKRQSGVAPCASGCARAACVAFAAFASAGGVARAQENADQDVSPNISVSERFAGNFAVDGLRRGSFVLFPVVGLTQVYDDNIFGAPTGEVDDFITDIEASLALRSDWSAHGLNLLGTVRRLQYFDNVDESTTDFGVAGEGVLSLTRRSTVRLNAGFARTTEARRTLQTAFGDRPVRFSTLRTGVDFDLRHNRLREQFGVRVSRDNFDDARDPTTGDPIDQDFRDRQLYEAYFRQSFRLRPTVSVFGEVRGDIQEFDADQIGIGADQDSRTYAAAAGVAFDVNKVARGEIGVGYQSRNFDNELFEDIAGFQANAALEYFVSDLTTITIAADRGIQNTAVLGVAGFLSAGGTVTVEHELLRSLLLVGAATYRNDRFRGVDRTDELLRFSAGADYAFRRNIVATVRFIRLDVSSAGAAARDGFDENIFRIGLEFRR